MTMSYSNWVTSVYIYIWKIHKTELNSPHAGNSQILIYWVSMNSVSDPFITCKRLCDFSDNSLKTFLLKQNLLDGKKLRSLPLISPSSPLCTKERVKNMQEKHQQYHYVWEDLYHTVFRWKRKILGPFSAINLDLCQIYVLLLFLTMTQ